MNKRDPLNIEDSITEGDGQESLTQSDPANRKKKRFIEPSISGPIDVLKTTAFFFDAPGDSGGFGNGE
jgi:hypothetical protein